MKITVDSADPASKKTDALCGISDSFSGIDPAVDAAVRELAGEIKESPKRVSRTSTMGMIPARMIMLTGLGRSDAESDAIRLAAGRIAREARDLNLKNFAIILPERPTMDAALIASCVVEGAKLALYEFDEFRGDKAGKEPSLAIMTSGKTDIKKAVSDAEKVADAVTYTRSLANLPPNECSPDTLVAHARRLCAGTNLRCEILGRRRLEKEGFGGIAAVGRESKSDPRLIILRYTGADKDQKPVAIVGKAVTFDSGGISLKHSEKMNEMKFDKCGGCAVLGIMKAVESLGLRVNVVGVIPAVENMPGGDSYRPGDIIRLYSGKTAEILNTDAEGRLILADALAYAEKRYSPSEIIDLATLTGACIVALGANVAGIISNDDLLAGRMEESSRRTMEHIWRLPLNDDYMEMIKSDVADMRNMGVGRVAGTIAAAAFLRNAIRDTPWAHLDIAGVAWTQTGTKHRSYNPEGATGFGVRLLVDHLSHV